MTDHDASDEQLLEQLRNALGFSDPPSGDLVDMLMTGYDIVNLDADLADLVLDTAVGGAPLAVRGDELGARLVSYEGGGVRFDFEIGDAEPQLVGRVDQTDGAVHLDQPGNEQAITVDESGRFEFSVLPATPYRLRYVSTEGRAVATGWMVSRPGD